MYTRTISYSEHGYLLAADISKRSSLQQEVELTNCFRTTETVLGLSSLSDPPRLVPPDRVKYGVLIPGDFCPLQHLQEPGLEHLCSVGPVSTAAPTVPRNAALCCFGHLCQADDLK